MRLEAAASILVLAIGACRRNDTDVDIPSETKPVLAVDQLRGLPGVVEVEMRIRVERPTRQILHVRDWHYVSRDLYALDMRQALARELTDQEVAEFHRALMQEVETVQKEQMALLRHLTRYHKLKRVHAEGFSPKQREAYLAKIAVLSAMEHGQIPQLRRQLGQVRNLIEDSSGDAKKQAQRIEREILTRRSRNQRVLGP